MKTLSIVTVGLLACAWQHTAVAQSAVKTVSTAQEFLDAIGSNTTINIKGRGFDLTTVADENTASDTYYFNQEYDGLELCIQNVSNLTITSSESTPPEIITQPLYGDVISFKNCNNVTIENIKAGHGDQKGECSGGVFNIMDSENFTIKKCLMYGSGIEGITAERLMGLTCSDSEIYECTYSIMSLVACSDIEFTNCKFHDNQEFEMVNVDNCLNVNFNKCSFYNNKSLANPQASYGYPLFNVIEVSSVVLNSCTFSNNQMEYFCVDPKLIELKKTKVNKEEYRMGFSKGQ